MDPTQWSIKLLLLQGVLIAAAVDASLNFTAQEVKQDIFSSICSFRYTCNNEEFYSVFRERDGSPTNPTSKSLRQLASYSAIRACSELTAKYSSEPR